MRDQAFLGCGSKCTAMSETEVFDAGCLADLGGDV